MNVRELFDYDPLTGLLTWRVQTNRRFHIGDVAGSISARGYISVKVNGRNYRAHRIIFLWMTGEWPKDQIDHINLDRADNRWTNLREATGNQNQGNRRANKNNPSGFKGVRKGHHSSRWTACIRVYGKNNYLGTFDTPEQAHAAYLEAATKYFGKFARAA